MQPDQNQNQPSYSIDYLNQIASPPKKPGLSNKLFLLIVGGGLLLAIIVLIFILSGAGSGPTQKMQTLAARLEMLRTVSGDSQKNIKSSALRSTNSNLTVFLTNTNRDIVEPLANNGVDTKSLDESIVAAESGEELTQTLEDARLNAIYDRIYAREIGYQLDTVAALMKEIYDTTNSNSLKEFLENTDANLRPLIQQFQEFNASQS